MAKKKAEKASPFVPIEEQPYKLPENWCWVRLGDIYEINPRIDAKDEIDAAFIPMEKIKPGMINSYSYEIQPWKNAKKGHTQFADGDVAFAKISPCFENRKSMIINNLPNGIGGGTTELIILRNETILQAYTFWLISTDDFIRGGTATYSGTVGQQRISMNYVKNYPVPLAPLSEQQRIVDRIESLFAKLDEAKEKAQAALESFEVRKSAILNKAFSGELTKAWRLKHGINLTSWRTLTLSEVGDIVTGSTPSTKINEYYINGNIPFVKPADLNMGRYVNDSSDKITEIALSVSRPVRAGSTCVCCIGSIGKCGYLMVDAITNQQINTIIPFDFMNDLYVYYYCISDEFRNSLIENSSATTLPIINKTRMSTLHIRVPSKDEQAEIVRILDDFFTKEAEAKAKVEATLDAIDVMKKSILAKAFRGELGTNNPQEESAAVLVREAE